ncbi:hypothetical protein KXD40_006337 [Peronospora effusa]|uniref:RED-like N-terminal domain-containing protein n=1 Tax=Peronospora effusa TaxID=542832 RepID=A0A3M6VW36_9STRA|nr:hypothetical protein DD238_002073 [Peronospora effusa]RQM10612.1 hypothetical protein DD237_002885 [Peronospora effusa]UIZ25714.1 hypothetical protein KXD40_006337 [Peronospora effusa]
MDQNDFRQMLASRNKPHSNKHSYGGKRNLTETDLEDIKKLSAKKAKKKGKKPKNAEHFDEAEMGHHLPKNLYRDRAAERRKGDTGDMIDAKEYKHLDTEQSKFLGGDMEHTHLVKGLDYALLAQLKREKQKLMKGKPKKVENKDVEARKVETMKPRDGRLTFKSRMGRLVYFHACQSTRETVKSVKSELFLPGRMYYTFNLSTTEMESVPVSVQRSKEDFLEPDDVVSGIVDESLIERVQELMINKKKSKKVRKKEAMCHLNNGREKTSGYIGEEQDVRDEPMVQVDIGAAAVDDDEDIFPDVGEYLPMDQRLDDKPAKSPNKEIVKQTGYFSNLSASITEKEEAVRKKEEDAERAWKEKLEKAMEKQKEIDLEKKRKAKEVKMTGEADDYAEYQGISALADSDDEDDEETARRRKAAGLTDRKKTDHGSEEKARRKKQKLSSKLANDLEKINKIMDGKMKS